ncbi:MAG: hypothetical protein AAFV37_03525 [Pseudomonadota bacterium]
MTTLPMHKRQNDDAERFNGPILDREKLREGTYIAMLTAIGSVFLVALVKGLYVLF